jgi:hypothetical protein
MIIGENKARLRGNKAFIAKIGFLSLIRVIGIPTHIPMTRKKLAN